MDGFHTPKKIRIRTKNSFNIKSNSPILKIRRRDSCIPLSFKENLKNNNDSLKKSHSIKKSRKRNFSAEIIYEEPENLHDIKKAKYKNFSEKTKKMKKLRMIILLIIQIISILKNLTLKRTI